MSLILPERKLIFLHIPKCAGQSVQGALGVRHHHQHHKRGDLPDNWRDFRGHLRAPSDNPFPFSCNYNLRVALRTHSQLVSSRAAQSEKRYRLISLTTRRPWLPVDDLHSGRLDKLITFKPQSLWLKAANPNSWTGGNL